MFLEKYLFITIYFYALHLYLNTEVRCKITFFSLARSRKEKELYMKMTTMMIAKEVFRLQLTHQSEFKFMIWCIVDERPVFFILPQRDSNGIQYKSGPRYLLL